MNNLINAAKLMLHDYLHLQTWLNMRAIKVRQPVDVDEDISSHDLAETNGYLRAISETIEYMSKLREFWPDELTNEDSSSPLTVKE